jgi:hypothetical protein
MVGGGRGAYPVWGRTTPHQAWEDDTDEITKRLLKAEHEHQQREKLKEAEENKRRSRRYMEDLARKKAAARRPSFTRPASSASTHPPSPSPTGPVIEDRKPVAPADKHRGGSAGPGKRAGLTEIMSHARFVICRTLFDEKDKKK